MYTDLGWGRGERVKFYDRKVPRSSSCRSIDSKRFGRPFGETLGAPFVLSCWTGGGGSRADGLAMSEILAVCGGDAEMRKYEVLYFTFV